MKFLAFTDLHANTKALKALVKRASAEDIDFVLCCGDVSNFGSGLRLAIKQFDALRKKFYLIPGNHESDRMLKEILPDYPYCFNFHAKEFLEGDHLFLGYGEGGFAAQDEHFRKIARGWYSEHNGKKIVLVTHGPPFGNRVDFWDGRHIGNIDFRNFIERIKPKLVISGHLHETAGVVDQMGETKVINPGWEGMVVELS